MRRGVGYVDAFRFPPFLPFLPSCPGVVVVPPHTRNLRAGKEAWENTLIGEELMLIRKWRVGLRGVDAFLSYAPLLRPLFFPSSSLVWDG